VTDSVINSQTLSDKKVQLKFVVKDEREDKFKSKGSFLFEHNIIGSKHSAGDLSYNIPLNEVFEKMLIRRFGNSTSGCSAEVKLKAFYYTLTMHSLDTLPLLGFLAMYEPREYHGFLKLEADFLNNNNKFVFHRSYNIDVKEMKYPQPAIHTAEFDMYIKAFNKFAEELEADFSRINFNGSALKQE